MIVASLGDALDGLVARRSGTVSVAGALLDASGDRYQEFFFLGGLAVYFRASPVALIATLLALVGSFMVSYGSAKAEAFGVPVPAGVMRRAERAVCLCLATVLTVPWSWLITGTAFPVWSALPRWASELPLLIAIGLIAVVGNVSAVWRLWTLGHAISAGGAPRQKTNAPHRPDAYLSSEPLRLKASDGSARP
jgi:CDP-diacylglycerol--glycerol-3-phosphate 3-phosphatidyltransferase